MKSVIRVCVVIFTLLAVVVQVTVRGYSRNVFNFMSILNGDYDNKAQYLTDTNKHDYIQFRAVPVSTPSLPGAAVLLIEWSFNRVILSLQLSEIIESEDGAILMFPYNFTDISNYTYGTFNFEDLSSLKPKDLHGMKICESEFESAGDALYVGTWPSCTHFINGEPALYADTLTCDDLWVVMPRVASEKSSIDPYDMKRYGKRYTVVGAPDDFVSPCD